jgi:predicted TIM-barrel fold metal-dependent hydrolase
MCASNRRDFLKAASLGAASLARGTGPLSGAEKARTPTAIIDTHTHFYDPTRPEGVPWPGKDDKVLYRRVLPADYEAIARPLGVTGTVVVEASPWLEDNQWVLELAAKDPFVVGLVGHLNPGEKEFQQHVERFAKNPVFRGIRIGSGPLKTGLESKEFLADLKRLAEHDLELDINGGPDMLPDVARAGTAVPELRIVINHCANVKIDGKAVPSAWLQGMQAAARRPNTFCKVSALVEGAVPRNQKPLTDLEFYRPVLDALWNAFGEDRLIYGSNWPVSERAAPYAGVQGLVGDYFGGKGEQALEKYFWRNSLAAYKWVQR